MSALQVVGGGVFSVFLGFGSGHAIQGRFYESGWKFAAGEGAALGSMLVGGLLLAEDSGVVGGTMLIGGGVGFVALRIWEIVHGLTGPSTHNSRYREVHWKAYQVHQQVAPRTRLYVAPSGESGGVAGLQGTF